MLGKSRIPCNEHLFLGLGLIDLDILSGVPCMESETWEILNPCHDGNLPGFGGLGSSELNLHPLRTSESTRCLSYGTMEYCLRWKVCLFPQIKTGSRDMGVGLIVRVWDPTVLSGDPWYESRLPGFPGALPGDLSVCRILSWTRLPEAELEPPKLNLALVKWITKWACLSRCWWGFMRCVRFGWHVSGACEFL